MEVTERRRLSTDARRAQIIGVATSLIAEGGYNSLTLSRLAAECGLTRAGLSHHFAAKEEIFVEVLSAAETSEMEPTDTDPDRVDSLHAFRTMLDRVVFHNSQQPEIVRLYTVLSAEALDATHPAHHYFAERLIRVRSQMAEALSPWSDDPYDLAVEILSFMDGIQVNWIRDPAVDLVRSWTRFADKYLS